MSRRRRDYVEVLSMVGVVLVGYGGAIALCALLGAVFDYVESGTYRLRSLLDLMAAAAVATGVGLIARIPASRKQRSPGATVGAGAGRTTRSPITFPRTGRRPRGKDTVTRREAILAVALIWICTGVFGSVPFMVGAGMAPWDALFEAVSGLTTTGATVITKIEGEITRPLLLWRSLIQWLGGMGIVVFFVAVFPNLRGGGKHMFGEEVPGTTTEGLRPRIKETSLILWKMYSTFTIATCLILVLCGMTIFEGICHAMTAMSTGGFSTKDASIGGFNNPLIEWVLAGVMLIGSVNYGLYYAALRANVLPRKKTEGQDRSTSFRRIVSTFIRSTEFRVFCSIVLGAALLLTGGAMVELDQDISTALRNSVFMVATTISSTGYGTHDYSGYPPVMLAVVLIMMFIGGCAGSTAGGIKVERIVVMTKVSLGELRRTYRPNLIQVVRLGRKVMPAEVVQDTLVFFVLFMTALMSGILFVNLVDGVPVPTAFGAVLSCLSNMGPAPFYLEVDNFAGYSAASKTMFVVLMLLGRLEFFALLAVLTPGFWKT